MLDIKSNELINTLFNNTALEKKYSITISNLLNEMMHDLVTHFNSGGNDTTPYNVYFNRSDDRFFQVDFESRIGEFSGLLQNTVERIKYSYSFPCDIRNRFQTIIKNEKLSEQEINNFRNGCIDQEFAASIMKMSDLRSKIELIMKHDYKDCQFRNECLSRRAMSAYSNNLMVAYIMVNETDKLYCYTVLVEYSFNMSKQRLDYINHSMLQILRTIRESIYNGLSHDKICEGIMLRKSQTINSLVENYIEAQVLDFLESKNLGFENKYSKDFERLSKLTYESEKNSGSLTFLKNQIEYKTIVDVQLDQEGIYNYSENLNKTRKTLQITTSSFDWKDKINPSLLKEFDKKLSLAIQNEKCVGFISHEKLNAKIINKKISENIIKDMLTVEFNGYGKYRLYGFKGNEFYQIKVSEGKLIFDDIYDIVMEDMRGPDNSNFPKIINEARKQKHGTMLLFLENKFLKEELKRLSNFSIPMNPIPSSRLLKEGLLMNLSAIDGALLFDMDCKCHSIGVILDGVADEFTGDISRGARYNSALKYAKYLNKKQVDYTIIVLSEDGMMNPLSNDLNSELVYNNVPSTKVNNAKQLQQIANSVTTLALNSKYSMIIDRMEDHLIFINSIKGKPSRNKQKIVFYIGQALEVEASVSESEVKKYFLEKAFGLYKSISGYSSEIDAGYMRVGLNIVEMLDIPMEKEELLDELVEAGKKLIKSWKFVREILFQYFESLIQLINLTNDLNKKEACKLEMKRIYKLFDKNMDISSVKFKLNEAISLNDEKDETINDEKDEESLDN